MQLAIGEPASPGVATGVVVTDPEKAEERARHGDDVVLGITDLHLVEGRADDQAPGQAPTAPDDVEELAPGERR